jgi:hypothetical protein
MASNSNQSCLACTPERKCRWHGGKFKSTGQYHDEYMQKKKALMESKPL